MHAAATKRDLTIIAAVPVGDPIRIVLTTSAAHLLHSLSHQLLQHAQPDANTQREQPLLRCPHELLEHLLDPIRQPLIDGPLRGDDLRSRYGPHGGSSRSRRRS
jgi:hypothetical protein